MKEKVKFENGFLDNKIQNLVDNRRNFFKDEYSILERYNKLCYKLEQNFEMQNVLKTEIILFTIFSQIHKSFQSFIILIERGLYDDSQIILRSIYDKIFDILFLLNDTKNYIFFEQDYIDKTIKKLNFVKDNSLYEYMEKNIVEERLSYYNSKIKQRDDGKILSKLDNSTICKKNGINELYLHYKILSEYTHNSITVIENHIIKSENEIIINHNFDFGNFLDEIVKVIGSMNYVVNKLCDYLHLKELKKEFYILTDELVKLDKNQNNNVEV